MSKKFFILALTALVFLVGIFMFSTSTICSSHGLQPVQMDCECSGFEFRHPSLVSSEGNETQCIGKIEERTCYEGEEKVDCNDYEFGFGSIDFRE